RGENRRWTHGIDTHRDEGHRSDRSPHVAPGPSASTDYDVCANIDSALRLCSGANSMHDCDTGGARFCSQVRSVSPEEVEDRNSLVDASGKPFSLRPDQVEIHAEWPRGQSPYSTYVVFKRRRLE